ncbi:MAG: glycosyltransferase family 2 protein [Hydrotalea sp. AMD]|uniref:glycosyltransferase family 2 protein n=1 Tax=Hydrotalea sp. AMD TaxID=2501297 RepID=UPI000944C05E|nr:glycosyltransferase family 2 protein [Hydrotalea sp. AMD]RWZ88331.1 MAG: glycosyltransferase family 2 protein [Hydrotalea sp. AMD]
MNDPFVFIVILNWNGYLITLECLKSLLGINYNNYEILLVDNGSTDESLNILRNYCDKKSKVSILALDKNYGFTGGNNQAVEYILKIKTPDFFLFLNNDTEVDPDFLSKMVDLAMNNNKIAVVVPKIYYFNSPNTIWYAGGYINKLSCVGEHFGLGKKDSKRYSKVKPITFMNGCAMLVKSHFIINYGLFDEIYFANCEDVDFSFKVLQNGYIIMYEANAKIWHKVSLSFKINKNKWLGFYLVTRNLVILQKKYNIKKWYFVFSFSYFLIRWLLYLEFKFLFQGNFTFCKYILLGFIDGFTKKNRLQN